MKNIKLLGLGFAALMALGALTGCGKKNNGADTYDKDGRLILNLKNVLNLIIN